MIPYVKAELEDRNQFNSEMDEDIQGLFKLPNVPTNQDTDIHPTTTPTPTPLMKSQKSLMARHRKMQQMIVTAVEEGNTDISSPADVEWTRRGSRIVPPSHLRYFVLGEHE